MNELQFVFYGFNSFLEEIMCIVYFRISYVYEVYGIENKDSWFNMGFRGVYVWQELLFVQDFEGLRKLRRGRCFSMGLVWIR